MLLRSLTFLSICGESAWFKRVHSKICNVCKLNSSQCVSFCCFLLNRHTRMLSKLLAALLARLKYFLFYTVPVHKTRRNSKSALEILVIVQRNFSPLRCSSNRNDTWDAASRPGGRLASLPVEAAVAERETRHNCTTCFKAIFLRKLCRRHPQVGQQRSSCFTVTFWTNVPRLKWRTDFSLQEKLPQHE